MEQLTPELERRLQVEELWARRNVLCDSINASRRARFHTRHQMLSRLGTQALPLPVHVVAQAPQADEPVPQAQQPMRPAPPDTHSGARRALRFAGFAAAAGLFLAIGLQGAELAADAGARLETYVPRLAGIMSHRAATPAAPVHASAAQPPDLRAEVDAEIAAAIGRRR